MARLELLPDTSDYGFTDNNFEYRRTVQDGAAGFYAEGTPSPNTFPCKWTLSIEEYQEWRAFYLARLDDMDAFDVMLVSNKGILTDHKAKFDYNTFSLADQSGETFRVSCSIIAMPKREYAEKLMENGAVKLMEDGSIKLMERAR